MRKVKEVLRLRFEVGLGQRQIARSCGMGLSTVHEYLERAWVAGIGWPLPEGLGEEELEAKLFAGSPGEAAYCYPQHHRDGPQQDHQACRSPHWRICAENWEESAHGC